MKARLFTGPRILIAIILLVLAGAAYLGLRKPAVEVEAATIARGPLRVTVNDLAETRVHDFYTVAAPVAGELLRVPVKPGDVVKAGMTMLAQIRPAEPAPLDARTLAQSQANVEAASAQAAAARSQVRDTVAALDLAQAQFGRTATLREQGFASQASLDAARSALDRARAARTAALESEDAAGHALQAARAALIGPEGAGRGKGLAVVRAPVSGFVLSVPQESMRVIPAGTPLVAIGDPKKLELVTDLLSQDAVRVQRGADVSIEDWGGPRPLKGRVRLIEPYGFLKVSALGVEEQRVNVVIDLAEPAPAWRRLGHGFRATVRITVFFAPDVVRVPLGALFRVGNDWQTFRIDREGRARVVRLKLGHMNEDFAEVASGLRPGDRVVIHPGDKIADGVRVRPIRER